MALNNTQTLYGSITKSFHWAVGLIILSLIPLGFIAAEMSHSLFMKGLSNATPAEIARAELLFSVHKTLGVAVFFLALGRIFWAITQPKPGLLHPDRTLENLAADLVHWLLYGAIVIVPLSGWIHHAASSGFAPIWWPFGQGLPLIPESRALSEMFGELHEISVKVMIGALFLHIAGAVKHHIIDRDLTLRRMLPGKSPEPERVGADHPRWPIGFATIAWLAVIGIGLFIGSSHNGNMREESAGASETENAHGATLEPVAGGWGVLEGTIGISITQLGSEVSGEFKRWDSVIEFDPEVESGLAGSVEVSIDITSLTLGSVGDQALGEDYFNASLFPQARYVASILRDESGYQTEGELTIKGISHPLNMPFDLIIEGDVANVKGQGEVNRLDFEIGVSQQDEATLGLPVMIGFDLSAEHRDE